MDNDTGKKRGQKRTRQLTLLQDRDNNMQQQMQQQQMQQQMRQQPSDKGKSPSVVFDLEDDDGQEEDRDDEKVATRKRPKAKDHFFETSSSSSSTPSSSTRLSLTRSPMSSSFGKQKLPVAKGGKKTIKIKPLKKKPVLPESFEDDTWAKLRTAMRAVFEEKPLNTSQEELYRAVEDLCIHKMDARLFQRVKTECEEHVKTVLGKLSQAAKSMDHESFLTVVDKTWEGYTSQMLIIRSIFLYLDRTYLIQSTDVRSLWDMGLQLFRRHIDAHKNAENKLISGLLRVIERERTGDSIDRSMLKKLLRMLLSLQIYVDSFEKLFLEKTRLFYSVEGQKLIGQLNVPELLTAIDLRLSEELGRTTAYLAPQTRRPLIATVEKQLIERHVETILQLGFDELMNNSRFHHLSRMFQQFTLVNSLDQLQNAFTAYIRKEGGKIVQDLSREDVMVQELLVFMQRVDRVVGESFRSHQSFKYAQKSAFEHFINDRENKPAEMIAKFMDIKLRVGNKGMSEDEVEQVMDQVLELFSFIRAKDMFEGFYMKDFGKRLLLEQSASIDAERMMITKLKVECGSSFTNKLEVMLKDKDISRDLMDRFRKWDKTPEDRSMDLQATVITSGSWPIYAEEPCTLPEEIAQLQSKFQDFYVESHSGRILKWQNVHGHAIAKVRFPYGDKELCVSLFQTAVLTMYNRSDRYTYAEIKTETSMSDMELKRTLMSLSMGKHKVLKKFPKEQEIKPDDKFFFNMDFTAPKVRIRINKVQLEETKEEQEKTEEKVLFERIYIVDAAIVRIMKARKRLVHAQLVSEVVSQLRFQQKVSDIKKRIDSLLEQEYISRETVNGASWYVYLA